jgi:hypothetical protein
MTPEDALFELLERVGAGHGAAVLVSEHELGQWPNAAVAEMKSHGLLARARPATSAVCPGCERECVMPVQILPDRIRAPEAFIVCDKRSDINRLAVPVSHLEQWQASGASIANLLAGLLGLRQPSARGADTTRWEIGMLKGVKHSSHLVLLADGRLSLALAGHSIALADVLVLEGDRFTVDKRTLKRLADQPIAGAGDAESAAQRRERLKNRVQEVKAKGTRAFLKAVAEEEGISVSRLKQLVR